MSTVYRSRSSQIKPDYDKLYRPGENFRPFAGGMRVGPEDIDVDAVGLTLGVVKPRKAVRFVHTSGKRLCDVIWTTYPPLFLISKRFRDLLQREGCTGWATYPVAVYDHEGKRLRDYFGLSVTGRAGPIDDSRSRTVWRGPKYQGGPKFQHYLGMFFKDDNWDGCDIFTPEKTSFTIMTERVKYAVEDAVSGLKIPNVEFCRLSALDRDIPGSLRPKADRTSIDIRIAKSSDVQRTRAEPIDVERLADAFDAFPPFRKARLKWSTGDHFVRVTRWGGLLIHFFGHELEINDSGRPYGTAQLCDVHIDYNADTDLRLLLTLCIHLAEAVDANAYNARLDVPLTSESLEAAVERFKSMSPHIMNPH